MERSRSNQEFWVDKDFETVPIQQINGPYGIFFPTRQDLYLVIRVQVNLDVYTALNFGRSGELRLRIGRTREWISVSKCVGELDGSHLSTAIYLRKSSEVYTFALLNPNAETAGLTLSCAEEFDEIVHGFCQGEILSNPILAEQTRVSIDASSRFLIASTTTISLDIDGNKKSETSNGPTASLAIDTTLDVTPRLHLTSNGTGHPDGPAARTPKVEIVVHSKPFG